MTIKEPRELPKSRHAEAFCLMKYQAEDGRVEWIWNSRDGVTPFTVALPQPRGVEGSARMLTGMTHADWHEDAFIPNFIPPIGSRVFMDLPDFDPEKHQFNLRVAVVDEALHAHFRELAERHPMRPAPRAA